MFRFGCFLMIVFVFSACVRDHTPFVEYKTKNVIVIVIDGPRYSETWGDPSRAYIPVRDSLLSEGVLITNFRNNGATYTNAGHAAICTGNYESIANNGTQFPYDPSLMQLWLKQTKNPSSKATVIASKDKLHILSDCVSSDWHGKYRPSIDCGVNGDGTGGYRSDYTTFRHLITALSNSQPVLTMVNFKDPDYFAHQSNWQNYLKAIEKTDWFVGQIWKFVQSDPHYKNKTTLIVTNDHGRHLDGISNSYVGHGDDCEGCRHIEFFALSPDFKKNLELPATYEQIDVSATISELLHFSLPNGKGKIMREIFK